LFDDVDVSRTVGWFTTIYPIRLTLADDCDLGNALKTIAHQLRQIPQRGVGYGLLRYLRQESQADAVQAVAAPISTTSVN
jgi:hypothetical protein